MLCRSQETEKRRESIPRIECSNCRAGKERGFILGLAGAVFVNLGLLADALRVSVTLSHQKQTLEMEM